MTSRFSAPFLLRLLLFLALTLTLINSTTLFAFLYQRKEAPVLATLSLTEVLEASEKALLSQPLSEKTVQDAAAFLSGQLQARLQELRVSCDCTLLTKEAVLKSEHLPDYTEALSEVLRSDLTTFLSTASDGFAPDLSGLRRSGNFLFPTEPRVPLSRAAPLGRPDAPYLGFSPEGVRASVDSTPLSRKPAMPRDD